MDANVEKTQPVPPPPSADNAAMKPGETVFEYQIDKVLGGGGFGITYLAQDANLQLPVAIKEYFPSNLAVRSADRSVQIRSPDAGEQFQWGLERFIEEARALASFRHPNIVRVLRYFKENGTAYIVMEYETGDPLKRWLSRHPMLDQRSLLQLVYPLLDGLEAVHKLNFLHRDIKPDNIYIRAGSTPVLLDFGAARRVSGNHDMTNIVSPGFAPFEQYHSKGNQGPWTDLYSLGAVMYWMTTGQKPMESASRVREDLMPKAVDVGSRAAFGEQLLQAIDWALTPDETKRPQNVAALREALKNSEHLQTQFLQTAHPADHGSHPNSSGATSKPFNPLDSLNKNVMGTIMFLDLVAYSTRSVEQQVAIKTLFNELITKALAGISVSSRIMLDTGDGAAICFLGDPEEVLQTALLLRDLMLQKYGQKFSLRMGLHLGPVRMLMDINNRINVVGDGINVAQRIMDFSATNQITVSRAYYDVVSRISAGGEAMFEYLGARLDKHNRSHEIYALVDPNVIQGKRAEADTVFEGTMLVLDDEPIAPEDVSAIETDLIKAIGPLAHVLVKKTLARAANAQDLRELLSVSIQDMAVRENFIHPKKNTSGRSTLAASHVFGASSTFGNSGSHGQSHSTPMSSVSNTKHTSLTQSVLANAVNLSAEQKELLEQALGQYIGPLSKTLIRKEAARRTTTSALLQALSAHIDRPDDRAQFLHALKGKL
jgi:serine/threonine protein kinase